MGLKGKRIVLWVGAGANQKALANKIAEKFDLAGIVIDTHSSPGKKIKQPGLLEKIWDRFRFRKIYAAWKHLMIFYGSKYPDWPAVSTLKVDNINSTETCPFTESLQPDLVVVSGTALIKKPLLSCKTEIGIINLHTGLSPYVKGGPNCTNWCIANNSFDLVGNTIMWLNEGIDAGNLIATETIDIRQATDLDEAHRIVMDHAHDLYIRSIQYLLKGNEPYNSVPQNQIDQGQLYLTKMWTAEKRKRLLKNWDNRKSWVSSFTPETVSLPKQVS